MSAFGLTPGQQALVVATHPDDETLGCGGTIARLVAEGIRVHVLAVTVRTAPLWSGESIPATRLREFTAACDALGVTRRAVAWIDSTGMLEITTWPRAVIELIERHEQVSLHALRPDALLIPADSITSAPWTPPPEALWAGATPRTSGPTAWPTDYLDNKATHR